MDTIDTIMKNIVNLRIHIAPVGFEIDRIIVPATSQKADKVWLIAHDNVAEDKAVQYREKIEKELEQKGIKTDWEYLKSFQAYLYFDHGTVWLQKATAAQEKSNSLTATGLGVRGNINEWLSGYLEVGQPLSGDVNAEGNSDPRIFFSLNARY